MYDAIRKLIREDRIADALNAMDQLDLGREHASRLDTLHRRLRILENKAMGNLLEDRLLAIERNGIVEDVLKLLDHAEHPLPDTGEAAGAKTVSKTVTVPDTVTEKSRLPLYLGFSAVALAFAVWALWPSPEPEPIGEVVPTVEEEAPAPPDREEPAPAPQEEPTTRRPNVTLTDATNQQLREAAATKVQEGQLRVDPSILANRDVLRRAVTGYMTLGEPVDVAVAVYNNRKAPTAYNAALSKSLASYLDREWKENIQTDVLTQKFHDDPDRERLQLRAVFPNKDQLNVKRARYLLTTDIRNVSAQGKAELRILLFDVSRGKGFTRGKQIDIGTNNQYKEKDLLYTCNDFLKEFRERGLFK